MADLNSLTNLQLRERLLEYGYDIPSSVGKEFLLKKLTKVLNEKGGGGGRKGTATMVTGRKSVSRSKASTTPPTVVRPVSVVSPSPPAANTGGVSRRSTGRQAAAGLNTTLGANRSLTRQTTPAAATGSATRNNQNDEEEEVNTSNARPARRTTPGRTTTTRNSVTPARSPARTATNSRGRIHPVDLGSLQDPDDDDDDEQDEDEPMPEVQNQRGGYATFREQQPPPTRQATPPRSSLRASSASKRARPSEDSPPVRTSPLKRHISQISQNLDTSYQSPGGGSRFGKLMSASTDSSLSSTYSLSDYTEKFGIIVNGRKVQSDCIPNSDLDPKKFIFNIPEADSMNYVVVFLHENQNFTPGTAGQVYFGWPDERKEIKWHELGHISNVRPSAIFNVTDLKQAVTITGGSAGNQRFSYGIFTSPTERNTGRQLTGPTTAQIGISIEPLEVIVSSMRPQIQL